MCSFLTAASDFQLATSQIVLTRETPSANVQVTVPQEPLSTDAPLETFRLTLNDELGLAPSNLFFRDAVITIEDMGKSSNDRSGSGKYGERRTATQLELTLLITTTSSL